MPVELSTSRLRLTALTAADANALFGYRRLAEVARYQSFRPASEDDAAAFIDRLARVPFGTSGTWFQLGLRCREGGGLLGDLGVHFLAPDGRQVELGISVAPSHQGQGLASEALCGVIDHLFVHRGVHRVVASVDPGNLASMALFSKVGFRQEAHHRQSLWFDGAWVDDVVFAVLASEWRAEAQRW